MVVIDMDMPESCQDCRAYGTSACDKWDKHRTFSDQRTKRHKDCPIVGEEALSQEEMNNLLNELNEPLESEERMKTPEEKISYSVICEQMPIPHLYFGTYKEAEDFAKFEQPEYRPYYIVERVEHFEVCGIVGNKGRK